MAIICPGCGEAQPDGARFCSACGSKLPEQTPPAEAVQTPPAEAVQTPPVLQEQQTPPAEPTPAKRRIRKPLIIVLAACAVALAVALACILPILNNMRYDDIYQRLWGNLLMYRTGDNSQLVMLCFEDDMTCQVHTYYFFDDRHLTQSLPYTVADVQTGAAEIYIGGQRYTAVTEDDYGITLTDEQGNPYYSFSAYTPEELISQARTTLQTQRPKKLYQDYQQALETNQNTAEIEFGNLSKWTGYDMKDMLYFIFDPYPTLTCEPEEGSTTRFVFTVSGSYYPNKAQIPSYMTTGTMVAVYDIETGQLTVTEGSEILTAMDVYYLFGLGGVEKEAYNRFYG